MNPVFPPPSEHVLARHQCLGDDGTALTVLELRYVLQQATSAGDRNYLGARRWMLETGEDVRVIDLQTFEVLSSGELLVRHDH